MQICKGTKLLDQYEVLVHMSILAKVGSKGGQRSVPYDELAMQVHHLSQGW